MWVKYFPAIMSLGLVFAAGIYLTTLSTTPKVTILTDTNNLVAVQPSGIYEPVAADILSSSVLNRSKLTINTNDVANDLQAKFPELGEVVVTIPLISRRPAIQARPAVPAFILNGPSGSYVIDVQGKAVLTSSQLASSIRDKLPVISESSDSKIELGKQIVTTNLVLFISELQAQFKSKGISIESYTFPALANELHVRIIGKGYFVKFNTEVDARQQVGTFLAVQKRLDDENKQPNEYIDVRVDERAFYR